MNRLKTLSLWLNRLQLPVEKEVFGLLLSSMFHSLGAGWIHENQRNKQPSVGLGSFVAESHVQISTWAVPSIGRSKVRLHFAVHSPRRGS